MVHGKLLFILRSPAQKSPSSVLALDAVWTDSITLQPDAPPFYLHTSLLACLAINVCLLYWALSFLRPETTDHIFSLCIHSTQHIIGLENQNGRTELAEERTDKEGGQQTDWNIGQEPGDERVSRRKEAPGGA